jgi:hypothetical protein
MPRLRAVQRFVHQLAECGMISGSNQTEYQMDKIKMQWLAFSPLTKVGMVLVVLILAGSLVSPEFRQTVFSLR